ncbi:MAG: hypothetical protein QNK79_06315 [Synechococcus sp. ArSW.bin.68]
MEEWAYVDERELSNCRCSSVCVACQHFRHGVDQHCHTLVACNIRQQLLQQGQHLTKTCKLWAPTWQSTAGWAPEMG